ncbi:MAG: MAPEG family protein [Legionella sp.]|nr:MAG: MAPEG family protein [Legionella sp.]
MSTLVICLLIAIILPYVAKVPVAIAMQKAGGYNNHYPREQQGKLSGFGARAAAAHKNSFEALAVFSTAVLAAIATQHVTPTIEYLAMAYIATRIMYHIFYLLNWASLRSLIWMTGYACCIAILCLSV